MQREKTNQVPSYLTRQTPPTGLLCAARRHWVDLQMFSLDVLVGVWLTYIAAAEGDLDHLDMSCFMSDDFHVLNGAAVLRTSATLHRIHSQSETNP